MKQRLDKIKLKRNDLPGDTQDALSLLKGRLLVTEATCPVLFLRELSFV